jgi:hypothetical protein
MKASIGKSFKGFRFDGQFSGPSRSSISELAVLLIMGQLTMLGAPTTSSIVHGLSAIPAAMAGDIR